MKTLLDTIMFGFLGMAAVGTIFVLVLFVIWAVGFTYEVLTGNKPQVISRLERVFGDEV